MSKAVKKNPKGSRSILALSQAIEGLENRLLFEGGPAEQFAPFVPQEKFLFKHGNALTAPAKGKALIIAQTYLSAHAADLGLVPADVANPIVTDQYTDKDTGVTHIYLRQQLNKLPVD